ncbi:MAG TPA: BatA domain-containing protein, partial [Verrucomicrobiae bacterium]|nr:BatA domain-containing protein [Verrucomicrobiae bacterium]
MSFLTPLFLLGGLAIAAPILFHLIRRSTRERMPFSSLMFLQPTPPQITRRSRLENIFLLVLRCLAFGLLAVAFARPYMRQPVAASAQTGAGKRMVLLVDTSASMRRADLWGDLKKRAVELVRKCSPADQVSVLAFDRGTRPLVTFEQWRSASASQREALVANRLAEVSPGWFSTQLGLSLVAASELIEDAAKADQTALVRQVVVLSDFQEGARLDGLQGHEWPRGTEVVLEPLKPRHPTNAGLQWQTERDDVEHTGTNEMVKVRVLNASDSKQEQFRVGWTRAGEKSFTGTPVDAYVPPGQLRVVAVPVPPGEGAAEHLHLEGDEEDFDNTVHRVPGHTEQLSVLYLGEEDEKDATQ